MNWKYISRFLLGIVLGMASFLCDGTLSQRYPQYSSYLEFGHPNIIEKFLLTNFSEDILIFILLLLAFLIVLLVDLILTAFKGKKFLKYTAITLLGEMILLMTAVVH